MDDNTITSEEQYRLHVAMLERDLAAERAQSANALANQKAQAFEAIRDAVFRSHGLTGKDQIDLATRAITRAALAAQE